MVAIYSGPYSNFIASTNRTVQNPLQSPLPLLFCSSSCPLSNHTDVIHCHKGRWGSASFIRSMVKTWFIKSSVHRSIPMPVPLPFQARLPTPTPTPFIHSLICAGIMAGPESTNLIQNSIYTLQLQGVLTLFGYFL